MSLIFLSRQAWRRDWGVGEEMALIAKPARPNAHQQPLETHTKCVTLHGVCVCVCVKTGAYQLISDSNMNVIRISLLYCFYIVPPAPAPASVGSECQKFSEYW